MVEGSYLTESETKYSETFALNALLDLVDNHTHFNLLPNLYFSNYEMGG